MPCAGCAERREAVRQVGRVVIRTGRELREDAERIAREIARKVRGR